MFSGELGQVTTSICTEMGVYFYASRSSSKVSSTDVFLLDLSPALLRGISIYILYVTYLPPRQQSGQEEGQDREEDP